MNPAKIMSETQIFLPCCLALLVVLVVLESVQCISMGTGCPGDSTMYQAGNRLSWSRYNISGRELFVLETV